MFLNLFRYKILKIGQLVCIHDIYLMCLEIVFFRFLCSFDYRRVERKENMRVRLWCTLVSDGQGGKKNKMVTSMVEE